MLKKIKIILIIFSLIASILAFIPSPTIKSEIGINWMSQINDSTKITDLSIPGSHDSGALHSIADVSGKCQDLNIKSQLNIGVRFFDIRLKLKNNQLDIVHSFVDQKLKFVDVLNDMVNFIKENNSEFLIISIKKESDTINSKYSFEETVLNLLSNYNDIIQFDNQLPETIKEARGKIYIISRFETNIGIQAYDHWLDSTSFELNDLYIQDNYCINDIETKKQDILNTLELSNQNNYLYLNYTSCYLDNAFPPTYAGASALTINSWLIENLDKINGHGILISDFVTKELIHKIIERNFYEEKN